MLRERWDINQGVKFKASANTVPAGCRRSQGYAKDNLKPMRQPRREGIRRRD